MGALLAVFNRTGKPVDLATVERLCAANAEMMVDGQDFWFGDQVALAHQHFWLTRQAWGERQPLVDEQSHCAITADARLDNRSDLLNWLDRDDADGRQLSDAVLILLSYLRWDTACAERLRGDFAFVIWDARKKRLFAARDVLGARGLAYFIDSDLCLVGTAVAQLLAHPDLNPRINDSKIADFLAGPRQEQEETYYEDIYYCPPAHCLTVSVESVRKWSYWDLDPALRIRYKDEREYADHFLALLTDVVRCRLRTVGPVGISMSGGLDSTLLTAVASSLLPESDSPQVQLKSFSYVFEELTQCDEREFILPVIDRYQLEATLVPGDDQWTFRDIANWPNDLGYIFNDPYAWLPVAIMKAAQQEGCRVLLAGHYGDVLFSGGAAWAAGMIDDLRIGQLVKTVRQNRRNIHFRRDLMSNGLRHMIPQELRRQTWRFKSENGTMRYPGLDPSLFGIVQRKNREVSEHKLRRQFGADRWHRYLSLTSNTFAQGASAIRRMYNQYHLKLEMPYWDRALVEFVMAVPADQLGRPEGDRWLMRNAASERLPEAICERRRRTVFLPLMKKGVVEKEKHVVDNLLNDPLILQKKYVRQEWLQERVSGDQRWTNEENAYFLWKCLSLELWLRKVE